MQCGDGARAFIFGNRGQQRFKFCAARISESGSGAPSLPGQSNENDSAVATGTVTFDPTPLFQLSHQAADGAFLESKTSSETSVTHRAILGQIHQSVGFSDGNRLAARRLRGTMQSEGANEGYHALGQIGGSNICLTFHEIV